jgi:hypothetical protein
MTSPRAESQHRCDFYDIQVENQKHSHPAQQISKSLLRSDSAQRTRHLTAGVSL